MPRVKGQDKTVDKARKLLRSREEIHDLLSDHFKEAYWVIYDVMTDTSASAASRRSAANDIITMFMQAVPDAQKIVDDFLASKDDQKEDNKNPDNKKEDQEQKEETGNVFKFKGM